MKNTKIPDLIKKARRSANAAKELLDKEFPDFSVSRSYYAMYYATQAILLTKNLAFSEQAAAISALGRDFVKIGIFPIGLHDNILDAFDLRQKGDYDAANYISKEIATTTLKHAEEFIIFIEKYLKSNGIVYES